MPAKIDLTGKVFHRLTVKKEAGRDRYGLAMWECECSCLLYTSDAADD